MRLSLLVIAALVAAAIGDTGPLLMSCPQDWVLFHTTEESSCLKIMPGEKLFDDAYKACIDLKARMLSFSHRLEKVYFVNKIIIDLLAKNAKEPNSMWFFDPTFGDNDMLPKPDRWMVLVTSNMTYKIALLPNATAVPRGFLCETPAHPVSQRAQFQLEPDHLFIANFLIPGSGVPTPAPTPAPPADGKPKEEPKPFIVTFNCEAYGLPKPSIEWHFIHKADNQSLIVEPITAKPITDPREPLKELSMTSVTFFNLQRDCSVPNKCPADSVQERSQLIIVNPQLLNLHKSVVCVATNSFGSVFSHEAQFFVTEMGDFEKGSLENVTVKAGVSAVVPNAIQTKPDAAAADCFLAVKPADGGAVQLVPIEELNLRLQGGVQMSKTTFDLIIDAFRVEDAGDYVCRARLHNGRIGHVIKERTIGVKVEPCTAPCNLEDKPLKVVQGYPTVLSMNPLDNHIIRAGDDFLLECPCTGKRRPDELLRVNWNLRNRTDMAFMPIPILPQNSTLLIQRADRTTHSGRYHCQCVRGASEASDWSFVDVAVLPATEPEERKEILTAKVGAMVSLACKVSAESTDLGVFVEPLHGVQAMDDYVAKGGLGGRIEVERKGANEVVVSIKEVKEADAGVYGCRVTSNFGKWMEYDSYYTTLIVEK